MKLQKKEIEYDLKKKINGSLDDFVDVCAGKMPLEQVTQEIRNYMGRSPESMVVTIERSEQHNGYYTTIYIPLKDFTH